MSFSGSVIAHSGTLSAASVAEIRRIDEQRRLPMKAVVNGRSTAARERECCASIDCKDTPIQSSIHLVDSLGARQQQQQQSDDKSWTGYFRSTGVCNLDIGGDCCCCFTDDRKNGDSKRRDSSEAR